MDEQRLEILFQRYLNKTATDAEKREFFEFVREPGSGELLRTLSEKYPVAENLLIQLPDDASHQILTAVLASEKPATAQLPSKHSAWKLWMPYAAAVLLLILTGASYVFFHRDKKEEVAVVGSLITKDVLPGHNGAVLMLSNGRSIVLDTTRNGKLSEGFTKSDDKITVDNANVEYATLVTPMGRQQQITLSDGTKVWLNAGSSITFPTAFTGKERKVTITGEAYFEVAKTLAIPFIVNVNQKARIQVLGTHFNVNAYSNEPVIKTTLLEGSIQFCAGIDTEPGKQKVILQPGQQSQLDAGTNRMKLESNVETDKVIAWKNGIFNFNDATLKEVMNQLERWYDIEVVYEKGIPSIHFFGKMTRNIPLNDLLVILEKSKVHFKIEGRKLVVQP